MSARKKPAKKRSWKVWVTPSSLILLDHKHEDALAWCGYEKDQYRTEEITLTLDKPKPRKP